MARAEIDPEVWEAVRDEDHPQRAYRAWEKVLTHYQYLVEAVAHKIAKGLPPHLDVDDLIALGQVGLLKAADKFDPERGAFSKFASTLIWGAIMDGIRKADFAPRGLRKRQRDIDAAIRTLQSEGLTYPTTSDIADELGWTDAEVTDVQVSVLKAEVVPTDPVKMPAHNDPGEEDVWGKMLCRQFVRWLGEKDQTSQEIILLKYWKGMSLTSISKELGISMETCKDKHSNVLTQLLPFMKEQVAELG